MTEQVGLAFTFASSLDLRLLPYLMQFRVPSAALGASRRQTADSDWLSNERGCGRLGWSPATCALAVRDGSAADNTEMFFKSGDGRRRLARDRILRLPAGQAADGTQGEQTARCRSAVCR